MVRFRPVVIIGILVALIACCFVYQSIKKSETKVFIGDEPDSLENSVKPASFKTLLFLGPAGQFSSHPLDFFFLKALDKARNNPIAAKIPFKVYYRLNSLFWTFLSGLAIAFLFFPHLSREKDSPWIFWVQSLCVVVAVVSYYFWPSNMYYSMEMRPYALWNSLWFLLGMMIMLDNRLRWEVFVIAVLLCMTSSGAIFELFFLGVSRFLFMMHDRKEFWASVQDGAKLFFVPAAIWLYYYLHNTFMHLHPHYPFDPDTYRYWLFLFIDFWGEQWKVPFLCGLGIFLTTPLPQWRGCSVIFLTMLLLYLFAPILNFVILSKGVYFSGRYYQYFHLIVPFFALTLLLILPDYWPKMKKQIKS